MKGKNKTSETIVAYVLQIKVLHCSTNFRNGLGQRIYLISLRQNLIMGILQVNDPFVKLLSLGDIIS